MPLPPNPGHEPGSLFPGLDPIRCPPGRPILCIIVDAEEEFHWGKPVSARNNTTSSMRHQHRAHDVFSCYNARPTYLMTYPIASDPSAVGILRDYLKADLCDIGAQLHPWVTPPLDSEHNDRYSFPSNLPAEVEREKFYRLVDAVRVAFDHDPKVYKAGRYGFGPNTSRLLEEAGFLVDTSLIPRSRYTDSGGPDFSNFDYGPFWFGSRSRILELPVTRALTGLLARKMPSVYTKCEDWPYRGLRAAGFLARSRLIERITLSPEGSDLEAMKRLTRALLERGDRIFTLSYHSPSLEPGNTPYVRNHHDLAQFIDRLSGFLSYFQEEIGGVFMTAKQLHDHLQAGTLPADDKPVAPAQSCAQTYNLTPGAKRCLVVANTFPPVHGGSAIVYDSLARFGEGRVSVLAPEEDYRDGWPIQGWREFDQRAPFKVHRTRLLRTRFLPPGAGPMRRAAGAVQDLTIRLAVLRAIRRIVREENISVLCIGELVAGGWLASACRALFGVKTLIYVHGEEISTRTSYDQGGQRRRRALSAADGVIAVSRFTRDSLIEGFGVPPEKIELVSNGVDLGRFIPRPKAKFLVDRYRLTGRPVLLTVSRLYARKGIDRVIESLPRVLKEFPDLVYLIVGEGSYRPDLEALAADHELEANIIFAGAVPDHELTEHYSLGDVFIMANREMPDGETEGFGLVFLEANACGLPVIAGKAGGSVDAVTDQVNGLVVDGDNKVEIGDAIIRMFSDADMRDRLRETGSEVAHAASWQIRVNQFLRFCDRLTAKR